MDKVLAGKAILSYDELVNEMIVEAWYMVTEYHLNLGPRDTLESLVHYIQEISGMKSSERREVILAYLKDCGDKEIAKRKRTLTLNVPYRLQAPFMENVRGKGWDVSEKNLAMQINQERRLMYYFNAVNGMQNRFLQLLPENAYILDFGCGSGRDTKCFLDKGYRVDAIDGSTELCKIASEVTGIQVREMLFTELDEQDKYDGIWACSSILHANRSELGDIMKRMIVALKKGGVIYTSFKYGDSEGDRNGRYFINFTEETFTEFLKEFPEVEINEGWVTTDVRPGRDEEKWLNLLLGIPDDFVER